MSLVDQRSRQDGLATSWSCRDPKQTWRFAVAPLAESLVSQKPLAGAFDSLPVDFLVPIVKPCSLCQIIKKSCLLIVLSAFFHDVKNILLNDPHLLHLLNLGIPMFPDLLLFSNGNETAAELVQLIDLFFCLSSMVGISYILPCTGELDF